MIRLAAILAALALSACSPGGQCLAARVAIAPIPPGTLAYEMAEADLASICAE